MIQNIKISRLLKNIFFIPLKSTIHEIKQAIYKFKYDYVPLGLDKDFDLSTVKTVLIDRLDGKLGDTVCVLPFLKTFYKYCPNAKIYILSNNAIYDILKDCCDNHYEIITCNNTKDFSEIQNKLNNISDSFDLYINLTNGVSSRLIKFINKIHAKFNITLTPSYKFNNIKLISNFKKDIVHKNVFYIEMFDKIIEIGTKNNLNKVEISNTSIKSDNFNQSNIQPTLPSLAFLSNTDTKLYLDTISDIKTNREKEFLQNSTLAEDCSKLKFIGINPYGHSSKRKLCPKTIKAILERLMTIPNVIAYFVITPKEQSIIENIIRNNFKEFDNRIFIDKSIKSIKDVITHVASFDAFIGVDTATCHICANYDVLQLAIYQKKASSNAMWAARSVNAVNIFTNKSHMANITYQDIEASLEQMLKTLDS